MRLAPSTKLVLAHLADDICQLLGGPAPSGAPFIIDAEQGAKRQVRHVHRVARPSDYQPDLAQDPLGTGESVYMQASGVSECDSGRRNVGIWHLDAAIPERVRQGIVDLTRVIPMQPGKVCERLSIVSTDDPVRCPEGDSIRRQKPQPLP
jgi:hypothetical protein